MARISTYQLDEMLNGADSVIGTNSGVSRDTVNFTLDQISQFVSTQLFAGVDDGSFVTKFRENFIPASTTVTSTEYVAGTAGGNSHINDSVYASSADTLTIGTNIQLFTQPEAAVDSILILVNGMTSHVARVVSVNSTSRMVRFSPAIPTPEEVTTFSETGTRANVATFFRYDTTTIHGNLEVTGTGPGFTNTLDNSRGQMWCGTELQFQELVSAGTVDPNTIYFRLP